MKNRMTRIFKPKIIFTDFDGCLTDDRVWLNDEGIEFVAANRKDGLAANKISSLGIKLIIASTETNKVVLARGKKMGVEVIQGLNDKALEIDNYLKSNQVNWAEIWYIGNDLNDLDAIKKAGISLNAFLTIWCARGSQGLQAEWLKPNERQPMVNRFDVANVTTPPPPNQDAALRKIEADRKNAVPPSLETLAKLAELRKSVA